MVSKLTLIYSLAYKGSLAVRLIPNFILQESRIRTNQWLIQNQSKPKSNLGFLIVAVIWLLMIWLAYLLITSQIS